MFQSSQSADGVNLPTDLLYVTFLPQPPALHTPFLEDYVVVVTLFVSILSKDE